MTTVCVAFLGTGNAGKSAMFKHLLWLDDPDAAWNDVDGAKKEFVWHLCSLVASFQNETNPGAFQSVPAEDIQMLTEAGVAALERAVKASTEGPAQGEASTEDADTPES